MRKLLLFNIILLLCFCANAQAIEQSECSGTTSEIITEHFTIIHQPQSGNLDEMAGLLEAAYERFNVLFGNNGFTLKAPDGKLAWIYFDRPEYFNDYALSADKMDLSWLSSYYSIKTNKVALLKQDEISAAQNDSANQQNYGTILAQHSLADSKDNTRIMHEAAHQLSFNTGIQKRGVMYPLWVSEGLATMLETMLSDCSQNRRSQNLSQMLKNKSLISLDEFVTVTQLPQEIEKQKDFYAQSCGFYQYLWENHKDKLKIYLDCLYKLQPGPRSKYALRHEFINAFGSLEQMDKSWLNFIREHSKN